MRTFRIFAGRMLALLLGAALLGCMDLPVRAAASADLDFTRSGTISLTLKTANGKIMSGGTVTLYQVAELYLDDGNMAYRYTSAFDGCGALPDVEDSTLPSTLAAWVREQSIGGVSAGVGSDGTIRFTDLALGMYLLVQTSASSRYETFSPFIVTVPMEEELEDGGSVWSYEVDASPKVGVVTPRKPPERPDPPDGSGGDSASGSDSPVVTAVILPQTGQLIWPIPVLAVGGLLFWLLGWFLTGHGRKGRPL